mmetsp:Transcript_17209/g.34419  ORF Transcript_17209/g.34419 Transcript_17209/m.34419 type:complete len:275 (-) Transcript_17209:131-955(-)
MASRIACEPCGFFRDHSVWTPSPSLSSYPQASRCQCGPGSTGGALPVAYLSSKGMWSKRLFASAGIVTTNPSIAFASSIWHPRREVSCGSKARSIISCSSSVGCPTLSNHSGSTMTWHVEHAMTPLHAHSMTSRSISAPCPRPCCAMSRSDMPSKPWTLNSCFTCGTLTWKDTFSFPTRSFKSISTLFASTSRPASSPTSNLPANEQTTAAILPFGIPDDGDCNARTMPSTISGPYPASSDKNLRVSTSSTSISSSSDASPEDCALCQYLGPSL